MAAATVTPVTTGGATVTHHLPVITTTTVAAALKGLKTTPATKPEVTIPSTSNGATSKTTHKTSGPTKTIRSKRKHAVFVLLSSIPE